MARAEADLKSIECALAYRIMHFTDVRAVGNQFNLCVNGDNEIFKLLNSQLKGKKFKDKDIRVLNVKNYEISGCSFLYIGRESNISEDVINKEISNSKIIVVSSSPLRKNHTLIFFKQNKDKIEFSVNKTLLDNNKMSISSKVLRLASEVY